MKRWGVLVGFTVLAVQAAGCGDDAAGLSVDVAVDPPTSPPKQDGGRVFTNDKGYRVVVTKGYLATSSVEILSCPDGGASLFWDAFTLERTAYAHSVGSPTRLGTPTVVSLLGDTRLHAGSISPPPGAYCSTRIGAGPADDDALFLPTDAPMVGNTLYLEGTYQGAGAAAPTAFTATATLAFDTEVEHPRLELSGGGRHQATVVVGEVGDHWFDGIDFANTTADQIGREFLENAQHSFQITVQ